MKYVILLVFLGCGPIIDAQAPDAQTPEPDAHLAPVLTYEMILYDSENLIHVSKDLTYRMIGAPPCAGLSSQYADMTVQDGIVYGLAGSWVHEFTTDGQCLRRYDLGVPATGIERFGGFLAVLISAETVGLLALNWPDSLAVEVVGEAYRDARLFTHGQAVWAALPSGRVQEINGLDIVDVPFRAHAIGETESGFVLWHENKTYTLSAGGTLDKVATNGFSIVAGAQILDADETEWPIEWIRVQGPPGSPLTGYDMLTARLDKVTLWQKACPECAGLVFPSLGGTVDDPWPGSGPVEYLLDGSYFEVSYSGSQWRANRVPARSQE